MALKVESLTLNTGRDIPAIGFGTGTSFFNRGEDVAALVGHAFQVCLVAEGVFFKFLTHFFKREALKLKKCFCVPNCLEI